MIFAHRIDRGLQPTSMDTVTPTRWLLYYELLRSVVGPDTDTLWWPAQQGTSEVPCRYPDVIHTLFILGTDDIHTVWGYRRTCGRAWSCAVEWSVVSSLQMSISRL